MKAIIEREIRLWPTRARISFDRAPTNSGEEYRLQAWRPARWHVKLVFWRNL